MAADRIQRRLAAILAADVVGYSRLMGEDEVGKGRYSPAECVGARKEWVEGKPDPKHVSTSYVERSNLTIRMHVRRFTRLTNAFSKKVENHAYAVALHMMYYNFVRIHSTLRMTPAMAAGVSNRLWEIGDIVKPVEDAEAKSSKREPYKKRIQPDQLQVARRHCAFG